MARLNVVPFPVSSFPSVFPQSARFRDGVVMASCFTAHNIRLDDGSLTKPEQPWLMEDLPLLKFTKQFLRMLFPDGVAGKRVVDLGCLEGGYTVEFARQGFEARGIEVRESNFEKCQRVKAGTHLPNLTFAHDDVQNLAKYG